MARDKAPADGEDGRKKKEKKEKKGKRKLILLAGVVVLIGAGAVVGLKVFGASGAEAAEAASEPPAEGEVLDLGTLTTTVSGNASLARVGLAVVTAEGAASDVVTAKFPVLKDAAVSELARSDAQVLRSAEGADDLRKRLTRRAKKIYPDGEVLRVLLTELVVQ